MRSLASLILYVTALFVLPPNCVCLDDEFPSVEESFNYLQLSALIYELKRGTTDLDHLPGDLVLHLYEDRPVNDCAMVVSSESSKFIAAVFSGSDTANDFLHDLEVKFSTFGPTDDPINEDVLVHKGFNNAMFNYGNNTDNLFDRVKESIDSFFDDNEIEDYDVVATGHSLGAATSQLMAVGLAEAWSHEENDSRRSKKVSSINFASPLVGDISFKTWVETSEEMNLAVWRHVLENDIIPRVPFEEWGYLHSGHTIWFKEEGCSSYYMHYGDESLGYVGVPSDFYERPFSIEIHFSNNYVDYMLTKSLIDPDKYYSDSFETDASFRLRGHREYERDTIKIK